LKEKTMAKRTPGARGTDAPESAAKDPNPAASGLRLEAEDDGDLVGRTVSINSPRQALYAFWRDFRNLALFMDNLESVQVFDDARSHWKVKGPADTIVEWDSIVTEDVPGELIAWRSADKAEVFNTGRVEFRDTTNGRGTQVTVTMVYDPPAGGLGKTFAKLFGREPHVQARRDLRRFKQLMETGEIPTSEPPSAAPRGD
jgi:uncharacterized membrane protein